MKSVKKKLSIKGLHALLWKEEDLFVAKCVEIEVASQGETQKAALENLEEAIALLLENESSIKGNHKSKLLPFSYA